MSYHSKTSSSAKKNLAAPFKKKQEVKKAEAKVEVVKELEKIEAEKVEEKKELKKPLFINDPTKLKAKAKIKVKQPDPTVRVELPLTIGKYQGVDVYSNATDAILFAQKNNLTGYHIHVINGKIGYMAGENHDKILAALSTQEGLYGLETTIQDFIIDTVNIDHNGEIKGFELRGDSGSRFDLEVDDGNGKWYDFNSKTFTTAQRSLSGTIDGGSFINEIQFPSSPRTTTTYTLKLTAIKDGFSNTSFSDYKEVYREDGTVDINASSGSPYNLITKEIIQGPVVVVNISSMAPTLADASEDWNGVTHATQSLGSNLGRRNSCTASFKITITAATNQAIKIDRQPTPSDIFVTTTEAIGAASDIDIISDEDIWSETARSTGKVVDGDFSGGATIITMDDDIGALWKIGDRVTGNAALDAKTGSNAVTITHVNVGNNAKIFTISESMAINDNETLNFTEPHYFRWPVTNVVGLHEDMSVDPNNANTDSGTFISKYNTYTSSTITGGYGGNNNTRTIGVSSVSLEGVAGGAVSATAYGRNTTQPGDIVFNQKQGKVFESQTVRFFAYGKKSMGKVLKGGPVVFSNLKAEIEEANVVTTTINDASATGAASLNDFDVTSKNGIMDDVSVVSGVNISTSGVAPVVSTIASSTGKNLTLTPGGHLVQNGQTLTFTGAASVITLTGQVQINDIGDNTITMYFDVEKFLTCGYNT